MVATIGEWRLSLGAGNSSSEGVEGQEEAGYLIDDIAAQLLEIDPMQPGSKAVPLPRLLSQLPSQLPSQLQPRSPFSPHATFGTTLLLRGPRIKGGAHLSVVKPDSAVPTARFLYRHPLAKAEKLAAAALAGQILCSQKVRIVAEWH